MKSLVKSAYKLTIISGVTTFAFFAFAGSAFAATAPDLGAAVNFVVLSHAGITDVPTSIITGNIGTDGVASSMGVSCPEVTGLIYTIAVGGPLCETIDATLLGTAMTDLRTAYTTANGEPTSGFGLNPGTGGEIGSLVLAPGVYTFTGGNINVLVSTDLILNGSPTDVWIFQIPGTFDVATNKKVTLTGGAVPANVFWVVAGQTTLHAGATLEGNILGHAGVAMQNLTTLHGRAFSSTESITLSANTISATASTPVPNPVFIDTNVNGILDSGEQSFATIQAAVNGANASDTVALGSDMTITSQVNINKALTLNGNGHKLFATFAKTDNSNNSAIGITASNVTIKNLVENGTGSTALHGINIFKSTGVLLDGVTVSHNAHDGVVVNGSTVTVNNITTNGDAWGGIDVDLGSGVVTPAILTVNGTSSHSETSAAILVDNITKNVSVVDTNNQYQFSEQGNLRIYNLKRVENQTLDLGTFVGGIGTTTSEIKIDTEKLDVEIPTGTVAVSTDTGWNGVINMPTPTTTPVIPTNAGTIASAITALEVGHGDTLITFDRPVKLIFTGQAGNLIGSYRAGVFTPITAICDSLTTPTLAAGADCKINNGADLIVWTRHFTTFVTYTQTAIPAPTNNNGGGGLGGSRQNISSLLAPQARGQVLGAFVGPEGTNLDSPAVTAIKTQIIVLIRQLITLLRGQLAVAISAGQY